MVAREKAGNPTDSGSEPIEFIRIGITNPASTTSARTPILPTFGWKAKARDLAAVFIFSAQFDVIVNENPLPGTTRGWYYLSRWDFPLGVREPEKPRVEIQSTLMTPVSNGLGFDYNGVPQEKTMQINLEH